MSIAEKRWRVNQAVFEALEKGRRRFLIVDNTSLEIQTCELIQVECQSSDRFIVMHVTHLTTSGVGPGQLALSVERIDNRPIESQMGFGMNSLESRAETAAQSPQWVRSGFASEEEFKEYKSLSKLARQGEAKNASLRAKQVAAESRARMAEIDKGRG